MRRFLGVLGVMLLCALSLAGVAKAAEPSGDLSGILACQPLESALLKSIVTPPAFCDQTADHGSSPSCEAAGKANGAIKCPKGEPFEINCSVPSECANGHWCKCTFHCRD